MFIPLKPLNMFGTKTITLLILVLLVSVSASAGLPTIVVKVGDTVAAPGATNTVISVYLDNRIHDIFAFNVNLQLNNPDIMIFQVDTATVYDTTFWVCDEYSGETCIDSTRVLSDFPHDTFYTDTRLDTIGNFDTQGTLCEGWELVESRSLSGTGADINIAGISDFPGGTVVPSIPAGQQGGVLIKILADVFPMDPDELERTVNITVETAFKDHFGFSLFDGTSITWIVKEFVDTTCWECTQWYDSIGGDCSNYVRQTTGSCDSLSFKLDTVMVLDTANVKVHDGSLTVLTGICGNADGSVNGQLDIDDIVYMVDYMYGFPAGPAPSPLWVIDTDGSGLADIDDLIKLIDYMFGTGAPLCCECKNE